MTHNKLKEDRDADAMLGNQATQWYEFDQIIDVTDRLILRTGGGVPNLPNAHLHTGMSVLCSNNRPADLITHSGSQ